MVHSRGSFAKDLHFAKALSSVTRSVPEGFFEPAEPEKAARVT
jgi:hypothetical protein